MTNDITKAFIQTHINDDIHRLALQSARFPDVDMIYAITQIEGWQKARQKLPTWAHTADIVYPVHLSMEQCSSEKTASYKASLCRRLLQKYLPNEKETSLIDITGGFGVDFSFMAREFHKATYIEQQQTLCNIARHNMPLLRLQNIQVIQGDGLKILSDIPACSVVFADPARRDNHGARTYAISDCTPDVLDAETMMLSKACFVILKLSPMLDIQKAINDLQEHQSDAVKEIHIVASDNECKELLIVLSTRQMPQRIYCVNNQDTLSVSMEEWKNKSTFPVATEKDLNTHQYLYEPHAAIMKAGCFHTLTTRYPLKALSASSHLFISTDIHEDFPGRKFHIETISTLNKRELKDKLNGISHANITTRNFPMTATELRKRLKLQDGGDHYLFASTTAKCTHLLFVCTKV